MNTATLLQMKKEISMVKLIFININDIVHYAINDGIQHADALGKGQYLNNISHQKRIKTCSHAKNT